LICICRFDAPSNLSPQGSWLGGVAIDRGEQGPSRSNSIVIGSPHDYYHHSRDSSLHSYNQLQEFKRRIKSSSFGSDSDVDVSDSYRRRLQERSMGIPPAIITTQENPSPQARRLSANTSQRGWGPQSSPRSEAQRSPHQSIVNTKTPPELAEGPTVSEPTHIAAPLVKRTSDQPALATLDRRLRRPLSARESESVIPMDD
jgi:hypothetical protein